MSTASENLEAVADAAVSYRPTDLFDLSGRVALVTGGSRGLGREMVLAFAQAGADVIIASRKVAACEATAAEVRDLTGREALAVGCNVSSWDDIDALVDASYDLFGRVDVLVNNAGMSPPYDRITDISESLYDKVFAVNLKGPFRLAVMVGDRMVRDGGGSIINISSVYAARPSVHALPYSLAKAGLNAMTVGLSHAFGPTVRVNAIMAGPFLTDISKAWDLEVLERQAERFALRRAGRPHEIVGAALYLASDASSYTSGAILPVDGGSRLPADPIDGR